MLSFYIIVPALSLLNLGVNAAVIANTLTARRDGATLRNLGNHQARQVHNADFRTGDHGVSPRQLPATPMLPNVPAPPSLPLPAGLPMPLPATPSVPPVKSASRRQDEVNSDSSVDPDSSVVSDSSLDSDSSAAEDSSANAKRQKADFDFDFVNPSDSTTAVKSNIANAESEGVSTANSNLRTGESDAAAPESLLAANPAVKSAQDSASQVSQFSGNPCNQKFTSTLCADPQVKSFSSSLVKGVEATTYVDGERAMEFPTRNEDSLARSFKFAEIDVPSIGDYIPKGMPFKSSPSLGLRDMEFQETVSDKPVVDVKMPTPRDLSMQFDENKSSVNITGSKRQSEEEDAEALAEESTKSADEEATTAEDAASKLQIPRMSLRRVRRQDDASAEDTEVGDDSTVAADDSANTEDDSSDAEDDSGDDASDAGDDASDAEDDTEADDSEGDVVDDSTESDTTGSDANVEDSATTSTDVSEDSSADTEDATAADPATTDASINDLD